MIRTILKLLFVLCAMLSALSVNAQNEPLSLPKSLDWSPDGTKIATGHRDGYIAIWDAARGNLLDVYQLMNPAVAEWSLQTMHKVSWSPDGNYLAIAELEEVPFSMIVVLDAATGARITHMETQGLFSDIAWSPDGQFLASIVSSVSQIALADALVIWNPLTGEEIRRINPPELQGLYSLAWSPDGQQIVVGGPIDDSITIWDVATGNKVQTLVGHTDDSNIVLWNHITGQIASGGSDGKIIIWNPITAQEVVSISIDRYFKEIDWSLTQPFLATVIEGRADILDTNTGQVTHSIPLTDFTGSEQIAWSPYGGRLAYTRIIPASGQGMTRSSNLNDNGIEMIVPIASIEQLNAIAELCDASLQPIDSLDALPDLVAQVESLPEGAIPAACRADLLAVADALR